MAEETDSGETDSGDVAEIKEMKQTIALLERACRQTLVFMEGGSCLDEYRLKSTLKHAIRESSKITNPKY